MPFGWDDAIMLGGTLASGALGLGRQNQEQANAASAMQMAQQNYLLQKQQMEQQYELSTAGRTDARGNRTYYTPGVGWQTDVTPTTKGLITASDAGQRTNLVNNLTRGEMERSQNFQRRQEEGGVANSMLSALKNRYGAPTQEGVTGASKVAAVTGANEGADIAKSAIASAALRSGGASMPTAVNFGNIDRGAATGSRTALARAAADAPNQYQAQNANWTKNLVDPYNTMATRATNTDNVPFAPEGVSGTIDAGIGNAANIGAATVSRAQGGPAAGINSILAANLQQKYPNYGMAAGGITDALTNLYRSMRGGGGGGGGGTSRGTPGNTSDSGWNYNETY